MNPYALFAIVIAWGASIAGAGYWAYGAGQDHCEAAQARDNRVAAVASDAAASAVAAGLSRLKVTNTTIRQTLQKETYEKLVFRECHSGPSAVSLLNQTTGASAAASVPDRDQLPGSAPTP